MIINADASHVPLADNSVQCVVTSPPYWGLRDYGTATWQGGDEECDHIGVEARTVSGGPGKQYTNQGSNRVFSGNCACGATRIDKQLGLEPTPEEYVQNMVAVFREVWRVLRDDGTCWVNMGDSYAGGGGFSPNAPSNLAGAKQTTVRGANGAHGLPVTPGLKPKDLIGIPWRLAFALQADGWYLRSDIIWAKPNPMPESVTDRPTKAHEYIFLLSKSASYYYDAEAIKENGSENPVTKARNCRADLGLVGRHDLYGTREGQSGNGGYERKAETTRNRRTVWTIATQPFSDWSKTVHWKRVSMDAISDDTTRIVSRDCPTHGGRFVLLSSALCGEHAADYLIHNFDKRSYLFSAHVVDSVPIARLLEHLIECDNSGFLSPACALSANDHNNEIHKRVHALLTNPACIVCGKKPRHTADKITELLKGDSVAHRLLSSISQGGWVCHPLVQIPSGSEDISSCCCTYYTKKIEGASHFATFPEDLVKPCIQAGTSQRGACAECGAPWERVVERESITPCDYEGKYLSTDPQSNGRRLLANTRARREAGNEHDNPFPAAKTLGWRPSCACGTQETKSCIVLDPFVGSGTTVKVAQDLGRIGIGLDLNPAYLQMGKRRAAQLGMML